MSVGEWAASFLSHHLGRKGAAPLPEGITLELVESKQTANLARREADLAVRHHPPEGGDLYIAKLGAFACAVYRRIGAESEAWITYTEEQAHYLTARDGCSSELREAGKRNRAAGLDGNENDASRGDPGLALGKGIQLPALSAMAIRCWNG